MAQRYFNGSNGYYQPGTVENGSANFHIQGFRRNNVPNQPYYQDPGTLQGRSASNVPPSSGVRGQIGSQPSNVLFTGATAHLVPRAPPAEQYPLQLNQTYQNPNDVLR